MVSEQLGITPNATNIGAGVIQQEIAQTPSSGHFLLGATI
jgi:hypothetical protein